MFLLADTIRLFQKSRLSFWAKWRISFFIVF